MKEKQDIKYKRANNVVMCICAGMIIGSVLSFLYNNIYLVTIGAGIGSGIGLGYVWLKYKK